MKAQFKYAFLAGLYARGPVFAVIFVMNTVFITLGSLDLLPVAAHITAVSLGGVAVGVMMAFNIVGDISVIRRMFNAPDAYLLALTPVPRWKTLLSGIFAMAVMDIISMFIVILQIVWLSFNFSGVWDTVIAAMQGDSSSFVYIIWGALVMIAGYLLWVTLIFFCIIARRSIFYNKPLSGLLSFLLGCLCLYIVSVLHAVLFPFGSVIRHGILFIITLNTTALPFYILLNLIPTIVLFVFASKLLERRVNI